VPATDHGQSGGRAEALTPTAPTTAGTQAALNAFAPNNSYQEWQVTRNGSGNLTITNPATRYVLDSAAVNPGAAVTVNKAGSANTQNWAGR
jgi:ricin-type beta-trefoil lectin protein